jgi:hypothetical protein
LRRAKASGSEAVGSGGRGVADATDVHVTAGSAAAATAAPPGAAAVDSKQRALLRGVRRRVLERCIVKIRQGRQASRARQFGAIKGTLAAAAVALAAIALAVTVPQGVFSVHQLFHAALLWLLVVAGAFMACLVVAGYLMEEALQNSLQQAAAVAEAWAVAAAAGRDPAGV